jgi:hypothetical protein
VRASSIQNVGRERTYALTMSCFIRRGNECGGLRLRQESRECQSAYRTQRNSQTELLSSYTFTAKPFTVIRNSLGCPNTVMNCPGAHGVRAGFDFFSIELLALIVSNRVLTILADDIRFMLPYVFRTDIFHHFESSHNNRIRSRERARETKSPTTR